MPDHLSQPYPLIKFKLSLLCLKTIISIQHGLVIRYLVLGIGDVHNMNVCHVHNIEQVMFLWMAKNVDKMFYSMTTFLLDKMYALVEWLIQARVQFDKTCS